MRGTNSRNGRNEKTRPKNFFETERGSNGAEKLKPPNVHPGHLQNVHT